MKVLAASASYSSDVNGYPSHNSVLTPPGNVYPGTLPPKANTERELDSVYALL